MSNTSLAYYKVKSPASILNSGARWRVCNRKPFGPAIRPPSGLALPSIALRHLASALIILLAGVAQAQRPAAATHVVRPGETLGLIAQSYGINLSALASANGISNAHIIHSWQELTIPSSSERQSVAIKAAGTHIVRPGESLGGIAEAYGLTLNELQVANNIWSWLIYAGQELKIPAGGSIEVAPAESTEPAESPTPLETSPPLESSGITHKVQFGETLGTIARDYGVSLADLQSLNGIWTWLIYVGQDLDIPAGGRIEVAPAESTEPVESPTPLETSPPVESSGITHKVQFGETLGTIARDYGVSLADLQSLNGVSSWIIYVGQDLEIPAGGEPPATLAMPSEPAPPVETSVSSTPARNPAPAPKATTHTVQPGETLFRIAKRYGLSLDALIRANGITDVTRIHSGLVLRISDLKNIAPAPQQPAPNPAPAAKPAVDDGSRKRYTVRRGDSLSVIGARLNMSWQAIADVNGITNPNALHAGTNLLLPTLEEMAKYSPHNSNARNYYFSAPTHPGPRVGSGREIVVQLSTQTAYAYENGILQKRALISSGLPKTPTVQGDFQVRSKVRSQRMSGPDYDLANVEWVMYFYSEYALHGTYWHYNFGEPMSHGCVNMTNADAKWFYDFASVGTPVHVRF